jgi:catechol 2,3-dioxygenase-like lactoylglutathione lyase family enzyme
MEPSRAELQEVQNMLSQLKPARSHMMHHTVQAWVRTVRSRVRLCNDARGRRPAAEAWPALSDTVTMGNPEPGARWPEHLPVGALRVVRWSARYDQTISFYRDIIGLPVLETFHNSYGLDGTILGLPGGAVHLEIVRLGDARLPAPGLDQLVFYLSDVGAWERITARLAAAGIDPVAQIDYWQANGGVTYQDPDGREVVFASWTYRPPS